MPDGRDVEYVTDEQALALQDFLENGRSALSVLPEDRVPPSTSSD